MLHAVVSSSDDLKFDKLKFQTFFQSSNTKVFRTILWSYVERESDGRWVVLYGMIDRRKYFSFTARAIAEYWFNVIPEILQGGSESYFSELFSICTWDAV